MAALCEETVEYTRENERRLEALKQRFVSDSSSLTEEERVELAILQSKSDAFVAEGIRRLESGLTPAAAAAAARATGSSTMPGAISSLTETVVTGASSVITAASTITSTTLPVVAQAAGTLGRAAYFWGSLVGTAVPAVAKMAGLTTQFDHWNFITDRLILGAMPVLTQVGLSGNHLQQLRQQLDERKQTLGIVAACLHEEEMVGFGLSLVTFARQDDWKAVFGDQLEYCYLPMPDGTASTSMESVRGAIERLHEILDVRKQCAYIHCKAGKGRSWMLTVCYLATYGGRSFENAETLVRMSRHQVNPSASQREFARDFCKKFQADEEAKRLMNDEFRVDAD